MGLPKDLLKEQGISFVPKLIMDVSQLLQVKQIHTSVYHPQTNGLVQGFSQTLIRMLQQVVDENGRNWDILLQYVLFAIWETPQASIGSTPFELLFWRRSRGFLDVAKEAWEEKPFHF